MNHLTLCNNMQKGNAICGASSHSILWVVSAAQLSLRRDTGDRDSSPLLSLCHRLREELSAPPSLSRERPPTAAAVEAWQNRATLI